MLMTSKDPLQIFHNIIILLISGIFSLLEPQISIKFKFQAAF